MVNYIQHETLSFTVKKFSFEELDKKEKEKKNNLATNNSGLNKENLDRLILRWNQLNEQVELFTDEEFSEWNTLECFTNIEKCLKCSSYYKWYGELKPCKDFLERYFNKS